MIMAPNNKKTESGGTLESLMLGYLCVKGVEGLPEKVNVLDRFALADADIAAICGCRIQSVRDARQKVKKGRVKKNE
jgi:hypothetical protein